MKKRALQVIIFNLSLLFFLLLYYKIASITGFYIPCMFKKITGLKCPGCGMTHMVHSTLHFDFHQAFLDNPVVFIICLVAVPFVIRKIIIYIRTGELGETKFDKIIMLVAVIILLIFGVVRNIIGI